MNLLKEFLSFLAANGVTALCLFGFLKWYIKKKIEDKFSRNFEKFIKSIEDVYKKQNMILEASLDYSGYIWKEQYDKEYRNYMEIWGALQKYSKATIMLRNKKPQMTYEEFEKDREQEEKKWQKERTNFEKLFESNAPFYSKNFYEAFLDIDGSCKKLFQYYENKGFNSQIDDSHVQNEKSNILKQQLKILDSLRSYLQTLKVSTLTSEKKFANNIDTNNE